MSKSKERKIKFPLRRNTRFTIDGVTKTLINWAMFYKINYGVVYNRVANFGWDIRVALRRPIDRDGEDSAQERIWDGEKYIVVGKTNVE